MEDFMSFIFSPVQYGIGPQLVKGLAVVLAPGGVLFFREGPALRGPRCHPAVGPLEAESSPGSSSSQSCPLRETQARQPPGPWEHPGLSVVTLGSRERGASLSTRTHSVGGSSRLCCLLSYSGWFCVVSFCYNTTSRKYSVLLML